MSPAPSSIGGGMPFSGQEMENLIKCNQKLKDLGIESTIRLPQICVIGDQSAGKSSLIEALSMIKVPRAANCCTQCPLAINISSGDQPDSPWKCVVSIEVRYEFDATLKANKITKSKPMGPWVPCAMQCRPFTATDDKNAVCDLIRAAQLAILNPGTDPLDFLPQQGHAIPTTQVVKFSPNIVKLDISQGSWPTLSFVDLPGIITNTDHPEEFFLIRLVENLVKDYATNTNMINILTLPMTNDVANSMARRIVQEIAAEPRTMAVFTKPDRVTDTDTRRQYIDKFLGLEQSSFQHGYHVVFMSPDPDLKHEEARLLEIDFFNKEEPWCSLEEKYQSRLGVETLRARIRKLLFDKTRETLPSNLDNIEIRLSAINQQIAKISPPPELDQLHFVLFRLLGTFEDQMYKLFSGTGQAEGHTFRQKWTDEAHKFRTCLANSKPTVRLQTEAELGRERIARAKLAAKKNSNSREFVELMDDDDSGALLTPKKEANHEQKSSSQTKERDLVCRFTLDQIRELNQKYAVNGLPRGSYPAAIQEMMAMSIANWNVPLNSFMQTTSKLVNTHIQNLVCKIFQQYAEYELSSEIVAWVKRYLDESIQDQWNSADAMCEIEMSTPYTLEVEQFSMKAEKCLAERQSFRNALRLKLEHVEAEVKGTSTKRLTLDTLPVDDFKTELDMSAQVRAYYEVACARFSDGVCQRLVGRLFTKLSTNLARELNLHLGPDDIAKRPRLQQLMAENPALERQRQELSRERERLIEGRAYIKRVIGVDDETQPETPADTDQLTGRTSTVGPSTPTKRALSNPPEPPSTNKRLKALTLRDGEGRQ